MPNSYLLKYPGTLLLCLKAKMLEEELGLFFCPKCELPFKAEDGLRLHIANWHSDEFKIMHNHKQANPAELLWHNLVHRVHETSEGFQNLSDSEKRYFAVCLLDGEVFNGGFHQYFFNSSGGYYDYTTLGLREMNAPQSLALLERAKSIFHLSKRRPTLHAGDSPPFCFGERLMISFGVER